MTWRYPQAEQSNKNPIQQLTWVQRDPGPTQVFYGNKSQYDIRLAGLESNQPTLERVVSRFQEKWLQEKN
jgi:hypothetical protein